MPRIGIQDRALFTVTELELIQSSFASTLKMLSRARVKGQISRARKYSNKYRVLARGQHRAKKKSEKGAAQPGSNVRTERKAQIFTDTLNRFEKRLGQLERQEQQKNTAQVKSPSSKPSHPPGKRTRNPEKNNSATEYRNQRSNREPPDKFKNHKNPQSMGIFVPVASGAKPNAIAGDGMEK